jgi:hypothetical protein
LLRQPDWLYLRSLRYPTSSALSRVGKRLRRATAEADVNLQNILAGKAETVASERGTKRARK